MLSLLKKGPSRFFTELNNPDTIIIKNKLYPSGLTERDIQGYYFRNKKEILEQTKNREIMLFVQTEDKMIVRRKDKNSHFFKLTSKNYEELIHGRVVSIHSTMDQNEDIGIVDIDTNNFSKAKGATLVVYDYLSNHSLFKSVRIRYTGKESFHIVCQFQQKKPINSIRIYLRKLLKNKFEGKYDIESKRTTGKINLDISSNKYRGGFITLGSLSVWGLKCVEVPRGNLVRFERNSVKIK